MDPIYLNRDELTCELYFRGYLNLRARSLVEMRRILSDCWAREALTEPWQEAAVVLDPPLDTGNCEEPGHEFEEGCWLETEVEKVTVDPGGDDCPSVSLEVPAEEELDQSVSLEVETEEELDQSVSLEVEAEEELDQEVLLEVEVKVEEIVPAVPVETVPLVFGVDDSLGICEFRERFREDEVASVRIMSEVLASSSARKVFKKDARNRYQFLRPKVLLGFDPTKAGIDTVTEIVGEPKESNFEGPFLAPELLSPRSYRLMDDAER